MPQLISMLHESEWSEGEGCNLLQSAAVLLSLLKKPGYNEDDLRVVWTHAWLVVPLFDSDPKDDSWATKGSNQGVNHID